MGWKMNNALGYHSGRRSNMEESLERFIEIEEFLGNFAALSCNSCHPLPDGKISSGL
jgi:hypothetical protein